MGRIALIDGDELAYKHALKYQRKWYVVKKDDRIKWRVHYKEEAIESIGNRDDLEIGEEIEILECKGFEEGLNKDISRILYHTSSMDLRIYLSGPNNFRYSLATLQPYKGNRPPEKPFHLETIQTELLYRKAESVDFLEADDLLSANYQPLKDAVICSSDKDLRTVPSLNYNIGTGKLSNISTDEAEYNFMYQLLIGDSTDNIPSPYGLGEIKAKEFLGRISSLNTLGKMNKLIDFYSSFLRIKTKDGTYKTKWYDGRDVREVLWEVGNLLWMHRILSPDERWELPNG